MYRRHWFPLQWMWQQKKILLHRSLRKQEDKLVWLQIPTDEYDVPVYEKVMEQYGKFTD